MSNFDYYIDSLKQVPVDENYSKEDGYANAVDSFLSNLEADSDIKNLYAGRLLCFAIQCDYPKVLKIVLDFLQVPSDNLTLKERIAYYQLTTGKDNNTN